MLVETIKKKLDSAKKDQKEVREMHDILETAGELERLKELSIHSPTDKGMSPEYADHKPNRFNPLQAIGIPFLVSAGQWDYELHAQEVREAYNNYMEEQHGDVEEGGIFYEETGDNEVEVLDIQTEESRLN